jgi:hypothetical protein
MEDAASTPTGTALAAAGQPAATPDQGTEENAPAQEVEAVGPAESEVAAGTAAQPRARPTHFRLESLPEFLREHFQPPAGFSFRFQGLLREGRKVFRLQGPGNQSNMDEQTDQWSKGFASFCYKSGHYVRTEMADRMCDQDHCRPFLADNQESWTNHVTPDDLTKAEIQDRSREDVASGRASGR